jgi:RNA polymerase sigma-70 factor (ECF subfamily)
VPRVASRSLGAAYIFGRGGGRTLSSLTTPEYARSAHAGEDGQWLGQVARGDADALGALYDRYGRVVFGVLYQMLGSPEAAEEVTQDAFHAVWRRAHTYRAERGSVRVWLLAITRNAAIDWRRTKGKRLERDATIDEAAALVEETALEDRVITSLGAERVRAAVAALPPEQRLVLSLAFWSGLSQSEIAARTSVPLGTVKTRVRLGMAKLRERLVETGLA